MLKIFGKIVRSRFELLEQVTLKTYPIRHRYSSAVSVLYRKNGYTDEKVDEQPVQQGNKITIPIRLHQRLEKKTLRDNSKSMQRRRVIDASRKGSSKLVITAKDKKLNHYVGQSYSSSVKDELPLVSRGWAHRKAAAARDFFKIHAHNTNLALATDEDQTTFSNLGLKSNVLEVLEQKNIRKPTLIQTAAIPKMLKGINCLISAETGSGKTLAYLLPIFQKILDTKTARNFNQSFNEPLSLILVPTRELGNQVFRVAESFGKHLGINVKLLQGGHIGSKIKGSPSIPIDLMVSTVNVAAELTKVQVYSTRKVETVILDEADTLLDDSFCEDVVNFLQQFPVTGPANRNVNLALVSATMPRLVDSFLNELVSVDSLVKITTPGLHKVMKHVPQTFLRLKKLEKSTKIVELVKEDVASAISVIVFCNKHDTCMWLTQHLQENEINCVGLTGGMIPTVRKGRLQSYLSGREKVLVCTDVGSRGIDTTLTGHVINYDFPSFMADYVHRCGRTGRVGSTVQGRVTNFISWATEARLVQEIERSVRQETSLKTVDANIKKQLNIRYGYKSGGSILP